MKGVVFTEFLEMVEARHSLETVDRVIAVADPASGAAYTSVGTYPAGELLALVDALSLEVGTPRADLLRAFGGHLAARFAAGFPALFARCRSSLDFLAGVHEHIHVEVRKLYADAELPAFAIERPSDHELVMTYRSPRALGDLAEGLIAGVGVHFGDRLEVTREALAADGTVERFHVRRAAA